MAQASLRGAGWQDDDCGFQAKSCVIEAWKAIPKKNLIIFADIKLTITFASSSNITKQCKT